jgi:ADP-heptose:LPS heptosyltransferase
LRDFGERLRTCTVLVSNDTGGMHLANALGVPVIALFGPTNPARTAPVFSSVVDILQPPGCPATGGGSLSDLLPETVAAALQRHLSPSRSGV